MALGLANLGVLVEEIDGTPSGVATKLKFTNGGLTNNGDGSFTVNLAAGAVDHGSLIGLTDDDHTQYGFLMGRSGGQTLIGGTDSGDDLILNSTSHATKGTIDLGNTLYVDEVNNRIGIGENAPTADFEINSTGGENVYIYRYGNSANPPSIKYWKARGTEGSPAKLNDGDHTGKIEFWGYARNQGDAADAFVRTAYILSSIDGTDVQNRVGGEITFYTSAGVSVTATKKLEVDKDSVEISKIATATAGTQYESWDLKMRSSVWDTDNVQAEDRIMYWTLNAGSGAHGSEPYYLSLYNNSDVEMMRIDPMNALAPAILIPDYFLHLGDLNTGFRYQEDRITFYAGGVTWLDMIEDAQDVLYIGNGALGDGADIDINIGTNNAIYIEGSSGDITINDQMNLDKTGTANAGTQYPSQDLILTGSVWDTTNTQAEDRAFSISTICGSGVNGSEPYRLSFENNDGAELMTIDGLNKRFGINNSSPSYVLDVIDSATANVAKFKSTFGACNIILSSNLNNQSASISFWDSASVIWQIGRGIADGSTRFSIYPQGGTHVLSLLTTAYVGINNSSPAVGLHIGTTASSHSLTATNDLAVSGASEFNGAVYFDGRPKLCESGSQDIFAWEGSIADDDHQDLPDAVSGFVMVTFDEGADYALCNITDAGVVTLVVNSVNVVNTDTDANYCIFDNGTTVRVRNRIGSSKNVKIIAFVG